MKIQRKKILKPLIQLHFIKHQYYKHFTNLKSIDNVIIKLKQTLKLIYWYEKKKKKIIFLGFVYNKFIHNQINHVFSSKDLYKRNNKFFNNFDLIVFNKTSEKDEKILKNLTKLHIPIIVLGNLKDKNLGVNLSSKTNYIKNFNSFIIFSILTKFKK